MSTSQTINQIHAIANTDAVIADNAGSYTPTEQYRVSEFTTYITNEPAKKLNAKAKLLDAVIVFL